MGRQKSWIGGLMALLPLFAAGCSGQASDDVGSPTLILEAFGGPSGYVMAGARSLDRAVGPQSACTAPQKDGACQLTSCKFDGVAGSPASGNFGPISVSAGTTTEQLTYYDGVGYRGGSFPPSVTLGTGDTMTFHGEGRAGVPMFDVSATVPGLGLITSPAPASDGGAAVIDASGDLSVTWAPISIGQINFGLTGGPLGGSSPVIVTCTFDGPSGSGVVPHSLLSSLKELSGERPAFADLGSELEATTVVDGLTITTLSYQNSTDANRDFLVTLQ